MNDKEYINSIETRATEELFDELKDIGCDGYYSNIWSAVLGELKRRIEVLEQKSTQLPEIPKDYNYDTETKDFLVYRHKYTGEEIHIKKSIPTYTLQQESSEDAISRQALLDMAITIQTDKDIGTIVDESVISVLFEYNPKRACEIMQGGYVEDGKQNDLLKMYDFRLQKKLNQWLEEKKDEEKDMSRFKIKFEKKKDKEKLYDYIDYQLDIVKDKKKSVIVKAKDYNRVYDKMEDAVDAYNDSRGSYFDKEFDYDIEDLER